MLAILTGSPRLSPLSTSPTITPSFPLFLHALVRSSSTTSGWYFVVGISRSSSALPPAVTTPCTLTEACWCRRHFRTRAYSTKIPGVLQCDLVVASLFLLAGRPSSWIIRSCACLAWPQPQCRVSGELERQPRHRPLFTRRSATLGRHQETQQDGQRRRRPTRRADAVFAGDPGKRI